MKRHLFFTMVVCGGLFLHGCQNNQSADFNKDKLNASLSIPVKQQHDLVSIDITQSIVRWKGTKLMHTGSHEGTVKFISGELLFSGNEIKGGKFMVDMKSIYNTDIPLSDPVPRRNITTHLNSDFETTQFPSASFIITRVTQLTNRQLEISGDMIIKGVTNPISVTAREIEPRKKYATVFSFDRHIWKIGESGSWLEQKVVDADVSVSLDLIMDNSKMN